MNSQKETLLLGIETSCDETAAAVVRGGTVLLSNVISSQMDVHRKFGGVVPEVASRRHVERMTLIIQKALEQAEVSLDDLDAIAVTQGPGLVGALLIGVAAAKALSFATGVPLVGTHHIAGHIYANHLVKPLEFPLVALVVSGGHTELIYMEHHNQFRRLGRTRDDAAGEAFDKVARLMGLPYPGGPHIDRLAAEGKPAYDLPRAWLEPDSLDFSFSGLKSAVIHLLHNAKQRNEEINSADLAASFQEAVLDVLVEKSIRAVKMTGVKRLLLAGGVSANSGLRIRLHQRCEEEQINLQIPPLELCTDNAAMIAAAGTYQYLDGKFADLRLNADPNLPLVD
ncbi:tRNA (adenosine(37)-N6)-threonylcarbamoyltransferase complex transferase subunit TsaD [Paenactinomyces guangxiensis]|uniref:tRNA N6-adenosine threonylcarbamoyltransferase n=1 Tax=Paenactinomyces guangxiensis TaxID=1490290 RepID=A0A7W2A9B9_9BACL|nr:tRNA (adenosine(37)-N6)-threonylcarbamoyltransferase complex transferase subunit TsaD [Paenactinomyces guangxiensis]MBA4495575.1 tRNA (adenosine(37)-N6)-threonylcarbamoyltransferase complex transferase subunit TsaD [Paenactinomyces guangxiensis]MBH8592833.1 tRNA (adenosine(37)-N6)-threonylcarbamoyltransferase complex transferase subunit TsaD [Paenactinomyces guangxiensis]